MDSYTVLGLSRDAGPAEIKRAYRRLAMAWHPDRNRHPEATERFKEIRAAYEALVNGDEPEAEEAAPAPPRAAAIRLDLELSLEEGAAGCTRTLHYRRGTPCATCAGTGEAGISRSRPCQSCHGSGRVRQRRGLEHCADCQGRGFISQRICPDCQGAGREEREVSLEVGIPPGMLPGDELRLAGQGEPGRGELAAGDLYVRLRFRPHGLFTLEGCDLSFAMPANGLLFLAGGRMEVPCLGGMATLELAPGDLEPRTVRLAGKGYPGRRGGPGDLIIHLQPVLPRNLDDRQRRLLQEVAAACADRLPEVAAWRRRYGF